MYPHKYNFETAFIHLGKQLDDCGDGFGNDCGDDCGDDFGDDCGDDSGDDSGEDCENYFGDEKDKKITH